MLIPKSKSVALIDFIEPTEARAAFRGLSYRKYHNVPIYLEWAPIGIIDKGKAALAKKLMKKKEDINDNENDEKYDKSDKNDEIINKDKDNEIKKKSKDKNSKLSDIADDEETFSTLFIKNLNFITDENNLKYHIENLNIRGLRTVSVTKKSKGDITMSMGFGFAEFCSSDYAEIALRKLEGSVLDGHSLQVKPSEKRISNNGKINQSNIDNNAKLNKNKNKNINGSMKLIVRNLAFQATENELKSLFSAFGSVKKVRIPKKMGGVHRGFAFIDFSTIQEASTAMTSLTNSHLYGRHLVIEYAKDEDENLDFLQKRTRLDEGAIKIDKKKRKIDDVVDGEGSAGVGNDDM